MSSTYNSKSIGLYLKDIRAIKRNSLTDKFANDPKYRALVDAWQSAENDLTAAPNDENKITIELKRRLAIEEYVNNNFSQNEVSNLPLTNYKGDRNKEIENCLPLVYSMAMNYAKNSNNRTSFEDLVAYGNLGLVIAADKYFTTDVPSESIERLRSKGFAKFSTVAWFWIKKAILEGADDMGSLGLGGAKETKAEANRNINVLGDDISEYGSSASEGVGNDQEINAAMGAFSGSSDVKEIENDIAELSKYAKAVFNPLSSYEKQILFMALGIDTPNGIIYKATEIADIMDVSKPTISRDLSKAYQKLRSVGKNRLHGEDAVTFASLILGNSMTDLNLPELQMEVTSGFEKETTLGAAGIKKYRTEF